MAMEAAIKEVSFAVINRGAISFQKVFYNAQAIMFLI